MRGVEEWSEKGGGVEREGWRSGARRVEEWSEKGGGME